jgi:glycosyltransferase involved in cell wall biosynthesis
LKYYKADIKVDVVSLGGGLVLTEEEYRRSLPRENILLSLGTVKPRKGAIESVEAFSRFLKQSDRNYKYYVIGDLSKDLPYVERLKALINKLGVQDSVILTGKESFEKIDELFRKAKLLLMPSVNNEFRFEGFGLVHLEAYGYGVPSIGSYECGNEQVIQNDVTGYLTKQGNIDDIYNALSEVLADDLKWANFSNNAINYARENTWDLFYSGYKSLYNQ